MKTIPEKLADKPTEIKGVITENSTWKCISTESI